MKRIVITIYFLSFITAIGAQDFNYGVIIGVNSYNTSTKSFLLTESDNKFLGLNLGLYGEYLIGNRLSGKLETIYSSSKENYILTDANTEFTTQLNTLQFVIKALYDFGGKSNQGVYIVSGTRFSILLSSSDSSFDLNTEDLYKKNYFAGQMGLGIKFEEHYTFELLGDATLASPLNQLNEASRLTIFANLSINLMSLIK